ncbi:MAG TPA: PAS domain S-box protein [Adhaeribacter sp.]|nr:PAS domain S-box protein [Adhaeribacter sp.]
MSDKVNQETANSDALQQLAGSIREKLDDPGFMASLSPQVRELIKDMEVYRKTLEKQQEELWRLSEKAAEHKARESRNFVLKIADAMPDIITVYDLVNRKNIYWNRELEQLLGVSPNSDHKRSPQELLKLVHPDDREKLQQQMNATRNLADGEVLEFEYRIRNMEGKLLTLLVRNVIFERLPNGEASQVLSLQQNITGMKKAEKELRLKNQIVNGLLDNLPVVVSIIAPDGTFLASTGSGLKSIGLSYNGQELVGQNAFITFPAIKPYVEKAFKGIVTNLVIPVNLNGNLRHFKNYYFFDQAINAVTAFSIDITERIEAERKLKAEQDFSQNLLDSSVDGILAFDVEMRFTAWNKVMEENTGLAKESILGKKMFTLFPAFENSGAGRVIKRVLKGKRITLLDQDFTLEGSNFEAHLTPLKDENGQVVGGMCILQNVTDRKKQEEESTRVKLDQQKAVLNAILGTQEEERKRIAEALHNGVGQLLYATKLNLQRHGLDSDGAVKMQKELLDEAIREIRTISFELLPGILRDFGLETAIQELLKRISPSGLVIDLHTSGLKRQPEIIEIAAYRIIQELLNNIIKHSKATKANVELICQDQMLEIMAKDNGIGFDPESNFIRTRGIGLTGILNRVKLLDGKMELETEPGKGTTVSIVLNVKETCKTRP